MPRRTLLSDRKDISISIEGPQYARLDAISSRARRSLSDLVRTAISEYLARHHKG